MSDSRPSTSVISGHTRNNLQNIYWTLFKCIKCRLHFTFHFKAVEHLNKCDSSRGWTCEECGKRFDRSDRELHKKQHELFGKFIVVEVSNDEMSNKVICKCVSCNICFDEASFLKYLPFGCSTYFEKCNHCNLIIHKLAFEKHSASHLRSNPKDNQIITNVSHKIQEFKIHFKIETAPLYKCRDCDVHYLTEAACNEHIDNHTVLETGDYIECNICKRKFENNSIAEHKKHHKSGKFDETTVDIQVLQPKKVKDDDLNDLDQKTLLQDVEISGVPPRENEDLRKLVRTIAKKFGVEINDDDVVTATRMGNSYSDNTGDRPPKIITRLAKLTVRHKLLKAARNCAINTSVLNLDSVRFSGRIYVNERLTELNRKILRRARVLKTRYKWKDVYTEDGQTYVLLNSELCPRRIRNFSDLEKIGRERL